MRHVIMQTVLHRFCLLAVLGVLAGCSSFGGSKPNQRSGDALVATPGYKVGAPYQVGGVWYHPRENYTYDETGVASWYGPGFHNRKTANGEIFDTNELTAAHPTLPMPCLARVTNLDNGHSVVVRINDRGPFAHGRLIDVSRKAADLLDFTGKGTAKVRVQVLANESQAIAQAAHKYGTERLDTTATYSTASVIPVSSTAMPSRLAYQPPLPPSPQRAVHNIGETGLDIAEVTQRPVKPNPQLYVQAGSFTLAKNAQAMQTQVAQFGTTKVDQSAINGVMFYRVRIGPISTVGKADAVLAKVSGAGIPNPRIIVD